MNFVDRKTATERINALGAQEKPFLFVIDYSMEHCLVSPLEEIDPDEILYSFPSWNNTPKVVKNPSNVADSTPNVIENSPKDANNTPKVIENSLKDAGKYDADKVLWKTYPEPPEIYKRKFDIIQKYQNAGDSFLTNLTCRIPIHTNLDLRQIFMRSEALYKLWFKSGFVCFSPEIFVRIEKGVISGYPMKGTIDATLPQAESILMSDEKEAAEHATIVDLIRNDLSTIASEVHVPGYRFIDRLHTNKGDILQTSSRVEGKLYADYRLHIGDIIFSQLPAGSITGAPKKRTVEIIREAEDYDRGFYTGVMGICCDGELESAVMIRFIEQDGNELFFKAGGGITARSLWENEYNEIIQKAYVPIY